MGLGLMPLLPRSLQQSLMRRRFFAARQWMNLHWGQFQSFEEALAYAARHGGGSAFDHDHEDWLEKRQDLSPHDYPMLFWLERLFRSGARRVVDLAGSLGVSYMAYRKVDAIPAGTDWTVIELPRVVARGSELAQARQLKSLQFTSDRGAIEGADVLFAAGALQYIDERLGTMLARMRQAPRHVLINRVCLTDSQPTFVTLQNTGRSITPYRVQSRDEFLGEVSAAGYRVRDEWRCPENNLPVLLQPQLYVPHFSGMYLERN